jgi:hypothetical protein
MARLLTVAAGLALLAVLFAGCGGGDDHAKVEASLRDYFDTVLPEETAFPLGLGVPRVRHNACKDEHVKVPRGKLLSDVAGLWRARFPEEVALWSCVVTVGSLVQPTMSGTRPAGSSALLSAKMMSCVPALLSPTGGSRLLVVAVPRGSTEYSEGSFRPPAR